MPTISRHRKLVAAIAVLLVFLGGIAAERYRHFRATNVGSLSVRRSDDGIVLTIDGDLVTQWNKPLTLRAGKHKLIATWQNNEVATSILVQRDDPIHRNQIRLTLKDGQLRLHHNVHLLDVAPRPPAEVLAIQTATGKFWHSDDKDRIVLRDLREVTRPDRFTIHWLGSDQREAFIQSPSGRFVTYKFRDPELLLGPSTVSAVNDPPAVFKVKRNQVDEEWFELGIGKDFVDADMESNRLRKTPYRVFALSHRLINAEADVAGDAPSLPAKTIVPIAASGSSNVRRLKGHTDVIQGVVFTPDSKHVISGSADGTIRFWSVQTGKQLGVVYPNRPVTSLAISGDGKSLAAGLTDAVVKLWSLRSGQRIAAYDERILSRDYQGDVGAISFSPDGTRLAAARNEVRIWNLRAPDERCKSSTIVGQISSLGWSPSGDHVLMCVQNGSIQWWPQNRDAEFHDARFGKVLIQSRDSCLVVAGGDLIDPETNRVAHSFGQVPGVGTFSAQLSQQGDLLVTGDIPYMDSREISPDELVTVWDLTTGNPLSTLREPCGQVDNTVISSNGQFVAYGSGKPELAPQGFSKLTGDYDIRLWSITPAFNRDASSD
ncbi:MAG: hypothetical protein AAFU85_01665 [Planctomycetota bacterium]